MAHGDRDRCSSAGSRAARESPEPSAPSSRATRSSVPTCIGARSQRPRRVSARAPGTLRPQLLEASRPASQHRGVRHREHSAHRRPDRPAVQGVRAAWVEHDAVDCPVPAADLYDRAHVGVVHHASSTASVRPRRARSATDGNGRCGERCEHPTVDVEPRGRAEGLPVDHVRPSRRRDGRRRRPWTSVRAASFRGHDERADDVPGLESAPGDLGPSATNNPWAGSVRRRRLTSVRPTKSARGPGLTRPR